MLRHHTGDGSASCPQGARATRPSLSLFLPAVWPYHLEPKHHRVRTVWRTNGFPFLKAADSLLNAISRSNFYETKKVRRLSLTVPLHLHVGEHKTPGQKIVYFFISVGEMDRGSIILKMTISVLIIAMLYTEKTRRWSLFLFSSGWDWRMGMKISRSCPFQLRT